MSKRDQIRPYKLFNAVDISTNQTSKETSIIYQDNVGILVDWAGTAPVGELFVEVASYDPSKGETPAWQALDFGSAITISGASGNHQININQAPFGSLRLRYAATSGSGTLTASIVGKTLGA